MSNILTDQRDARIAKAAGCSVETIRKVVVTRGMVYAAEEYTSMGDWEVNPWCDTLFEDVFRIMSVLQSKVLENSEAPRELFE